MSRIALSRNVMRSDHSHKAEVPEVVVFRLPLYLRILTLLSQREIEVVSSQDLGEWLRMTPAQIRKDLSYFGRFGKQGRGYSVAYLLQELRHILRLDKEWEVALVGVGRLGRAILAYPGFLPAGFKVVDAFDADPVNVGQTVDGIKVHSVAALPEMVLAKHLRVAIVAVPSSQTQDVVDLLVQGGVRAILNYAPQSLEVPPTVRITNVDPVLSLQAMTFYLP